MLPLVVQSLGGDVDVDVGVGVGQGAAEEY